MIQPKAKAPDASIGNMIPRILAPSEVAASGDVIEILRPRHRDPILRCLFSGRVNRWQHWSRYRLDNRGSRLWCLIDNQRTVNQIVAEYCRYYPEDRLQIEQRVTSFFDVLVGHGFLELVPAPAKAAKS